MKTIVTTRRTVLGTALGAARQQEIRGAAASLSFTNGRAWDDTIVPSVVVMVP
jgi:hypothetical protein